MRWREERTPASSTFDRPIFVVGAPRSGTTAVTRILGACPDVCLVDEPRYTWRYGNDRKSDLLWPADVTENVRHHVRARFERIVRKSGRSRLVEKTPSNALRLSFVLGIFPEARIIHVTRHPLWAVPSIVRAWNGQGSSKSTVALYSRLQMRVKDASPRQLPGAGWELGSRVIASRLRGAEPIWGPRIPGLAQARKQADIIDIASMQWSLCTGSAYAAGNAFSDPGRFMEFSLESLNENRISALYEFASLSLTKSTRSRIRDYFDPERVGRPCPIGRDLAERVWSLTGAVAEVVGYDRRGVV